MRLASLLERRWVKHPYPVLSLGRPGDWDDLMVDCPCIFSDVPGKYYLYYTGHSTRMHSWSIGFAESTDLFDWTKYEKNPVLVSGGAGSWDQRIDGPSLFKHDDKYYLFYEATSSFSFGQSKMVYLPPYQVRKKLGAARRWVRSLRSVPVSQAVEHAAGRCIGFAVSDDLVNWVKHPDNPVLSPSGGQGWDSCGVFSPNVHFINGLFYLFYGGSGRGIISSGMAISKDLRCWERKETPILKPGLVGSWDDSSVLIVSVVKLEDGYCAFYEGQDSFNNYGIGIAYSYDLGRWTRYDKNPVIARGEKGELDERMVNSPHVFIAGERAFMFYGAQDFKMRGHSMVAYLTNE